MFTKPSDAIAGKHFQLIKMVGSKKPFVTINSKIIPTINLFSNRYMIPFLLIVMGIYFRVRLYLFNRSLWLDEAYLTHNLLDRSWIELFSPLDYGQSAPVFFLLFEKFSLSFSTIITNRELLLRIFPLISGIATLVLIWLLAKKNMRIGAFFTLALFVFNQRLVYYSSEVKQYSSDVLISIILLWLAWNCITSALSRKPIIELGSAGIVLIWFSHPSVFILAGIGLSLGLDYLFKKEWRNLARIGLIGMGWILSFTSQYVLSMRNLTTNASLLNYWESGFMPMPPWNNWSWFPTAWFNFLEYPGNSPYSFIFAWPDFRF